MFLKIYNLLQEPPVLPHKIGFKTGWLTPTFHPISEKMNEIFCEVTNSDSYNIQKQTLNTDVEPHTESRYLQLIEEH